MNNIEKLLYLRGISTEYYSYSGELLAVPWEHRLQLLKEVGDDPTDENAIAASIYKLDAEPWLSWLRPVHIVTKTVSEHIAIRVCPDHYDDVFNWKIETETGENIQGSFKPAELDEVGDYYVETVRYSERRLVLEDLPLGYHQFSLGKQDQQQTTMLIVAPQHCFKGELDRQKVWGINCQLYTLRSERNWGIGDFTDLQELIGFAAAKGMDLISLNPLHAPCTTEMEIASPYSPSDRRFLNPLYIDPENVPEFFESKMADSSSRMPLQSKLSDLRNLELIDYKEVAILKYAAFDQMFRSFQDNHLDKNTERAKEFSNYVEQQNKALLEFAQFEAKYCGLKVESATDLRFHQYLQWLAEQQLLSCQKIAIEAGMSIGLMRDLAVGAVQEGAEVQGNPELYCQHATIGAPPDPLAQQGQNWNLPALDPIAMKQSGYQLFIDMLRANMNSCGALRIDHILGLLRLWWCHPEIERGVYVYYPMDDLLAILCLESQRNRCIIVGEDMGTVPNELRAAMATKSVYSNKAFYFEKEHELSFKHPHAHQADALLMVTNHDVPTLAGWWGGIDLQIRAEIGLIDDGPELASMLEFRSQEKRSLLSWLESQQLLPASWSPESSDMANEKAIDKSFDFELCSAIILANARSRSRMLLVQLDDLQLLQKPVNIPGTYKQYPNWRRKQKLTTRRLFRDPLVQNLLSSIQREDSSVTTS